MGNRQWAIVIVIVIRYSQSPNGYPRLPPVRSEFTPSFLPCPLPTRHPQTRIERRFY